MSTPQLAMLGVLVAGLGAAGVVWLVGVAQRYREASRRIKSAQRFRDECARQQFLDESAAALFREWYRDPE